MAVTKIGFLIFKNRKKVCVFILMILNITNVHTMRIGYYMFLRQQVIWCPSVSENNTKSQVDLKNM